MSKIKKNDESEEVAKCAENGVESAKCAENGAESAKCAETKGDDGAIKDADNKEIVAYALGGVSGQVANCDMVLKQNLMMFVLQLNPVLITFVAVLGTLWDAITDPIMAHITDNSKNRWGRRRPFILVGGILSAIFSIIIWGCFPKPDNIRQNIVAVPEVIQSQDALSKFGKMIKGYGIGETKLQLTLSNNYEYDENNKINNTKDLIQSSLKKINANIKLVNDGGIPLTIKTVGFEPLDINKDDETPSFIGKTLSTTMTLDNKFIVENNIKIEKEYKQDRGLAETIEDTLKLRNEYVGFNYDGTDIDFKYNTFADKSIYRARISLLEKNLIEILGQYYNLPYWKCFPKLDDKGKKQLRYNLEISNIDTNDIKKSNENYTEKYDKLLDCLVLTVEKRIKYLEFSSALKNKKVSDKLDGYLKSAKVTLLSERDEFIEKIKNELANVKKQEILKSESIDLLEKFINTDYKSEKTISLCIDIISNLAYNEFTKTELKESLCLTKTEPILKLFRNFKVNLENIENEKIVKKSIESGKVSRAVAKLINSKCLKVTDEELFAAKKLLLAEGTIFENYINLHIKYLLLGASHNMDLTKYSISKDEQIIIDSIMKKENLSDMKSLHQFLLEKLSKQVDNKNIKLIEGTLGLPNYLNSEVILSRFKGAKIRGEKPSFIQNISAGIATLGTKPQEDKIAIYMIIALIAMATVGTIRSVPYYALGIELAPSYNGRTKVQAIRSIMNKVIGLITPWLFPFILLPIFADGIDGTFWVGVIAAIIAIPLLVYSILNTKEKFVIDKKKKKIPILRSMKETLSIPEFWRVFALFFMLMKGVSIATMSGSYLILYWVFSGSMLEGAFYLAMLQSFAYILAIGSIPLITWICNKYQKHNALRFAIFMLICNAFATWFAYKPGYPMLMFILPFFGSVGISSMYTVMGTLMADVTDVDELRNGVRREGMFGAVNAMIMKALAPLGAIMTSIVIIMSGFDIDNGANQAEGVFLNMRLILVFLPLIFLGIALLLLYKYPLTRDRMMEIKGILAERRKKAKDK